MAIVITVTAIFLATMLLKQDHLTSPILPVLHMVALHCAFDQGLALYANQQS